MSRARRFIRRLAENGVRDTVSLTLHMGSAAVDYFLNPFAWRRTRLPPTDYGQVVEQMQRAGLSVVPCRVDVSAFHNWLAQAAFPADYVSAYGATFTEKALEHYLGATLSGLTSSDVLVDVAAANSP